MSWGESTFLANYNMVYTTPNLLISPLLVHVSPSGPRGKALEHMGICPWELMSVGADLMPISRVPTANMVSACHPQQQRREKELRKQQEREQRRHYEEQMRREEERRRAEHEQVLEGGKPTHNVPPGNCSTRELSGA